MASGSAAARSSPTIRENSASAWCPRARSGPRTASGQVRGPVTGRHQYRAGRAARQQRPHLGRVPGVVEQDQHPAAESAGSGQRRPLVIARRDLVAFDAKVAQKPGEDLARFGGLRMDRAGPRRARPSGNSALTVRRVHRERRLAEPGRRSPPRADRSGTARDIAREQAARTVLHMRLAPGEIADVSRELRRAPECWTRALSRFRVPGAAGPLG